MKKLLFPILALVLALGLAIPMAVPAAAATTTDYYSGNSNFDTETVAVSTSFVDYGLGGVTYGTANPVVNCWTHSAWAIVKTNYPQLATANWVSSSYYVEDPVGDSWRQFASTFEIPTGATNLSAVLENTADNSYEVSLNGTPIGSEGVVYGFATNLNTNYWSVIESWSGATIDGALQAGTNTLTVVVRNWAQTSGTTGSNPTGLIYKLAVTYEEFVADPEITIVKEADVDEANENYLITYTYTVTNTGNVPLSSIVVSDDLVSPVTYQSGDDGDGILQTTETWIYTGSYQVPWFTAGPVVNTATAEGYWETTKVTDDDDFSVDVLHNPAIEVTKSGPEDGYFQSVEAEYTYEVENTGYCGLLNVVLSDDMTSPAYVSGDTGDLDVMIPGETWTYEATELLECECQTITCFTNKATVTAEDVKETPVDDTACWSVMVFQWQPRTIGYWGNWSNHYSDTEMSALVTAVNGNSAYFEELTASAVHDLLLAPDQTGKMTAAKATILLKKQLLATWFNVKSYNDWVDPDYMLNFVGSADTAMDPNATVYVDGVQTTVSNLLQRIEWNLVNGTTDVQFLLKAKDILDKMNNAENNSYEMFIAPWFDADACPLVLENKDSTTWQVIDDERYGKLFYSASGDTFDFMFCAAGLDADTAYSLIYYADFEDRFTAWGGNNPGALIAEMTTDGHGSVCIAGSIDLGMDLPSEPDANIDTHDYSGDPDYYANAHGAKIWLVPSDDYNGTNTVTNWSPDDFLFETDLIWYTDTDD